MSTKKKLNKYLELKKKAELDLVKYESKLEDINKAIEKEYGKDADLDKILKKLKKQEAKYEKQVKTILRDLEDALGS